MNDQRPEGLMMIGLHKLAAQNGDGLVPELYELLLKSAERQQQNPNVTAFPIWEARMPGEAPQMPLDLGDANGNNVLAFPTGRANGGKKA